MRVIIMTQKDKLLVSFGELVADLQSFFQTCHPLTESEQLFIENRLLLLQIEYTKWSKVQSKRRTMTKRELPLFIFLRSSLARSSPPSDAPANS